VSRPLRILPLAVYAVVAALAWRHDGVPVLGDRLWPWLLGLVLMLSFTNPRRFVRGLFVDWLPFLAALTSYDLLRGIADGRLLPAHAHPQMWVDKYLFGLGTVPTVFLQRHLFDPARLHWYDYATWLCYTSYFFVVPLVAVGLWLWAPGRFRRYTVLVVCTSFAAMLTYVLYPAMPPWLASDTHVIPPVARVIQVVTGHMRFLDGRALFEHGTAWANDIAAMPSLHEGLTLLVAITLWPLAGRIGRVLLVVYPLAMAFALVYAAEHYVIEVVLGCVYTIAVIAVVNRAQAWWEARARRSVPASAELSAPG